MGCILKGGGGLYSRVVVGAVVLADHPGAGQVQGRPGSLLRLGGVPLIRRTLVALSGAGVDEVAVVLGGAAAELEPLVQAFPVTLVRVDPPPPDGPASDAPCEHRQAREALRAGLAALTGKLDLVLVLPATLPLLGAADVSALIGAWKKRPAPAAWVQAEHEGRPVSATGPLALDPTLREALLRELADAGGDPAEDLATLCSRLVPQVHRWPVDSRRLGLAVSDGEARVRFEQLTQHALTSA